MHRLLTYLLLVTTLLNGAAWALDDHKEMLTGHMAAEHAGHDSGGSDNNTPDCKDHYCSHGIYHLIGFDLDRALVTDTVVEPQSSIYRLHLYSAYNAPPVKPPRA